MPGQSQRQRMREAQLANQRASRVRRLVILGAGALAVVLIVVMAIVFTQQSQKTASDASGRASASASGTAPASTPGTTSASPVGSASGDVVAPPDATPADDGIVVAPNPGKPVVDLYFDYQCGPCRQFDLSFGSALDLLSQTHEIQLVNHPLVFIDRGAADGPSHKAALAAACADVVGLYFPYHTAIWEAASQESYTDTLFLDTLPAKAGITGDNLTTFQSCYKNKAMAGFVENVESAGLKAGLTDTPQLEVNGKKLPNSAFVGKTGDDLHKIIADAANG